MNFGITAVFYDNCWFGGFQSLLVYFTSGDTLGFHRHDQRDSWSLVR